MVLWCYGVYDRAACAHNEVTLISFCKDNLKAGAVPFEDRLPTISISGNFGNLVNCFSFQELKFRFFPEGTISDSEIPKYEACNSPKKHKAYIEITESKPVPSSRTPLTHNAHLAIRGVEVPWENFYTENNYPHAHTYACSRSGTTSSQPTLLTSIWASVA